MDIGAVYIWEHIVHMVHIVHMGTYWYTDDTQY